MLRHLDALISYFNLARSESDLAIRPENGVQLIYAQRTIGLTGAILAFFLYQFDSLINVLVYCGDMLRCYSTLAKRPSSWSAY